MKPARSVELGPENWFEAWWLAGADRRTTTLRRDGAGRLSLLSCPYDALRAIVAILSRAWCEQPADWAAAEWLELRDLEAQVLELTDELRRDAPRVDAGAAAVVYPPLTHAMFASAANCWLLDEAWRLEREQGFTAWLVAAVRGRDFAKWARTNVHLRRIAVEAARRAPSADVFDVVRRVYRDRPSHESVAAADREFIARGPVAAGFERQIAELGLHAPMSRQRFPRAKRSRSRSAATDVVPRVTVLIPSYRHESFIAAAISSCLQQSTAGVRVLVADDCSPDRTVEVARQIVDPRLTVTVNPTNRGLGASVLAALEQVDTPYVALLNSDDLFHPERLQKCLEVLESDAAAGLIATAFAVVDEDDNILTCATACAAEIGPRAYGWLRWHEGIVRDELHRPEDWTSLGVLLRHNVLATSSNMVFRTEWLRLHMPAASRLKYCLDWQLFLQASMEGSLRMIAEPLLAYRLHGANTVWFNEGGRADYVIEVNRVVDHVLHQWLARAMRSDGVTRACERFAELLEGDVRAHGETDAIALYLSDLVRRHPGEALDTSSPAIVALVESAMRRKVLDRALGRFGADPWSVPWRVQLGDRWQLERDAADGHSARARSLASDLAQRQSELAERRVQFEAAASDLAVARVEIERLQGEARRLQVAWDEAAERGRSLVGELGQRLAELADQRGQLEAAHGQLEAAHGQLRRKVDELGLLQVAHEGTVRELASTRERLARADGEGQRLQRELHEAEDTLAASRAAWALERAAAVAERDALARDLASLTETATRLQDDLAALHTEHSRLARDLDQVRQERERARALAQRTARERDRAVSCVVAEQHRRAEQLRSPEWRLGSVWMRRTGVLGAYKTATAWWRQGAAVAQRAWSHAQRIVTRPSPGERAVMFVDALSGGEPDPRLQRLRAVLGASVASIACDRSFARSAARGLAPIHVLDADARLAARDRHYFRSRNVPGVEEVERLFGDTPWLGGAWRSARFAKASGARTGVAQGLRGGAVQAYASKRLCGSRCVLALGDEDLVAHGMAADAVSALLRTADLLVVDSELVLREVQRLVPGEAPEAVVRWALAPSTPVAPPVSPSSTGALRVFVHWPAVRRADPTTLVGGVQGAVSMGLDVRVDVVGTLGDDAEGWLRWFAFEDELHEAGLAGRFRRHGELSSTARGELMRGADVVLWSGRSIPGTGMPWVVVEAFAVGRCVLAAAVPELAWCPAVAEHVDLFPPGDAEGLAAGLMRFAADPTPSRQRLAAGRALLERRAADDAAVGLIVR